MKFARKFLADLANLRLPVTAGAVATLFLNVVEPFGAHLDAKAVSGALVAVGALAALINHLLTD